MAGPGGWGAITPPLFIANVLSTHFSTFYIPAILMSALAPPKMLLRHPCLSLPLLVTVIGKEGKTFYTFVSEFGEFHSNEANLSLKHIGIHLKTVKIARKFLALMRMT